MQKEISFGEWVRQHRHILDLTQQELADQVGCARITLRRIESGALKPSKELAHVLLEKLGAPAANRDDWLRFARGVSGLPLQSISASNKPNSNLPAQLTTFIGRIREQSEAIKLITKHRLVTLTGSGGVGKTRLSIKVGEQLLGNYADGVWVVELAPILDPLLVPRTTAIAIGLRDEPQRPVIDMLSDYLREKEMLLILDNCEHLLDACAQLANTLLKHSAGLKVLATSREALGILGEAVYQVPPLELPDIQQLIEKFRSYESVRLFEERAQLARMDFLLTIENASAVAQICGRLDGIPLAIELAAARVGIFSTEQIAKQINDCFNLLTEGNRTALPRHQTLRASMDWSWGLLSEAEQTFLRQLSVFAGGWTLESAQIVCDGNVLNLTSALVKKSLVIVDQKPEGDTRYHFHEVVRQYMCERMIDSGEGEKIRARHLKYFLELSEQAEPALRGPSQMAWYVRLNHEHENIRAALDWADHTDTQAGLYLSSRLNLLWENFDIHEGVHWLEKFTQKPKSKAYTHARAKALRTLGWLRNWLENFAEARSDPEECLALYRACGDTFGEVDALLLLAAIVNPSEAMELCQQALALAQSIHDKWRTAYALYISGWGHHDRHSYIEKALGLFQEVGDLRSVAECTAELGRLEMLNNDLESAEERLNEAISLFQQLNIKSGIAGVLQSLGRIAAKKGNYEQAYSNLQEEAALDNEYGYRINYLFTRSHFGYLALQRGNIAEALEILTATMRIFFNDRNEIGVAFSLEGMAGCFVAVGKPEISVHLIGWSDALRKRIGDSRQPFEQVDVDKIIAACLSRMGEVAFSDAYKEGQKMTLDEAVDLALNTS